MVKPGSVASRIRQMDVCRWDMYFSARVMKRMPCETDLFGADFLRVLLVWAWCVRLTTAAVEFQHAPDAMYSTCARKGAGYRYRGYRKGPLKLSKDAVTRLHGPCTGRLVP